MRWAAGIVGFPLVVTGGLIFELSRTCENGVALWLGAFLWPRD
jgi:hypothetical protein